MFYGNLRDSDGKDDKKDWLLERTWTGGDTKDRAVIVVDVDGKAILKDGNHRIEALQELRDAGEVKSGYPIPTMIWYKGNSDLLADAWVPKSKQ